MNCIAKKSDALSQSEQIAYADLRDEIARALLLGQRLTLQAGQTARPSLRLAHAMNVWFRAPARAGEKTVTIDAGINGFAALASGSIPVGTFCDFALGSTEFGPPPVSLTLTAGNDGRGAQPVQTMD